MFGNGRIVSVPGKLGEEDTLFDVCEAERQGQQGGGGEAAAAPF